MLLLCDHLQRRPSDIFAFSFDCKGLWTEFCAVFMRCPTYKYKELAVFI
jgi:hypothetical protein